jgi:hypothetical protein
MMTWMAVATRRASTVNFIFDFGKTLTIWSRKKGPLQQVKRLFYGGKK